MINKKRGHEFERELDGVYDIHINSSFLLINKK